MPVLFATRHLSPRLLEMLQYIDTEDETKSAFVLELVTYIYDQLRAQRRATVLPTAPKRDEVS